ncbi:MAG: DUF1643 domain-containing protein [Phycisphaerales bacterium]|nr:DUF1643 domain-containing protein [Phycisphaerales bacterium]
MRGWATFDDSGTYRYSLHRRWAAMADAAGGRVCFCLLNPSTADAKVLDPTLTRCLGFAQRWGYGHMEVVNAFALRSTKPALLKKHRDPVGPDNDRAIVRAARRADLVVIGWGTHARLGDRHEAVLDLLRDVCEPVCFAKTKDGYPKHPLYLRSDCTVRAF